MKLLLTHTAFLYKKIICIALIMVLYFGATANSTEKTNFLNLDSLKKVLAHSPSDSITISQYMESWLDYYPSDLEAQWMVLQWCMSKSKRLNNIYLIAESYYNFAQYYLGQDDFANASKYCAITLKYADKYNVLYLKKLAYGVLATVYYRNYQYKEAENYALKALDIALQEKNERSVFACYNRLAIILLSDPSDSIKIQKGFYYIQKTLEAAKYEEKDELLARTHSSFGGILADLQMYEPAMEHFKKSMALNKNHQYPLVDLSNYLHMGNIYKYQSNYTLAEKNYLDCIQLSKKLNNKTYEYNSYYQLSDLYSLEKKHFEALSYFEKYTVLHDSIVNAENFAKAADVQNKYEREKKQKLILQLNKNNRIKQLKIEKDSVLRKKLYYTIAAVALVLCLLFLFVFIQVKNIREKRHAYNLLQQKNVALQSQGEQLNQQAKLISAYQSQMSPEFVFNAVNNFKQFVLQHEKEKSIDQMQGFAKLMRQTLENSEKDFITLQQEHHYLQTFIAFEQGNGKIGLDFTFILPADADEILIPPMLLQPLIQSCIQEAITSQLKQLSITIATEISNALILNVSIKPSNQPFCLPENVVHSITPSRLRLLHRLDANEPINAYFRISKESNDAYVIFMELPLTYLY